MAPDRTPSEPLIVWTGWEVRSAKDRSEAGEVFPQVVRAAFGGEINYELLAVTARGFRPPQFLSTIGIPDAPSLEQVQHVDATKVVGFRQSWSLIYRKIVETSAESVIPYAIYLLGVNPPPDATVKDLEVFNEFYTTVHLLEVADRHHALRAVRYELVHEVKVPYRGAPRFLAVYEVTEEEASVRRHAGPPYSKGPEVWQQHKTPWRLWYRRLGR